MDALWRTALWQQFSAAIAMFEQALLACPKALWKAPLWRGHSDDPQASEDAAFWSLTNHPLFSLDSHLTGSMEAFAPPTPFTQDEFGLSPTLPEQPYTKEELHTYLVSLRQKCQTMLLPLSGEQARREVAFPWKWWKPMSFFELQLLAMRHVQEHTAQLSLFLGRHGIPDEVLDWVPWVKDEPGSH